MKYVRMTSIHRMLFLAALLVGTAACAPPGNLPPGNLPPAQSTQTGSSSPLASPLVADTTSIPIVGIEQALVDAPKDAPKPDAGKASISGLVFSPSLQKGVMKTGFYLTKAVGEKNRQISPILIGPEESQGDIRGYTDEKGIFSVNNLEPGNYFIVLSAPNDWVPFERDGTSGVPKLVELKADEQLALGVLYAPWP